MRLVSQSVCGGHSLVGSGDWEWGRPPAGQGQRLTGITQLLHVTGGALLDCWKVRAQEMNS